MPNKNAGESTNTFGSAEERLGTRKQSEDSFRESGKMEEMLLNLVF